jgi:hypothetical protein
MAKMTHAELLTEQLTDTRFWTLKLVADLKGDDWFHQPAAGVAHALWLCGHIASAQDTLVHTRCLGRAVLDTVFKAHFAIGAPVKAKGEHPFPSPQAVLAVMADVHEKTIVAVRAMGDDLFAEPAFAADGVTPHPHYRDKRGAVSHCVRHEAFHAGQIATIRRLTGKPFLR